MAVPALCVTVVSLQALYIRRRLPEALREALEVLATPDSPPDPTSPAPDQGGTYADERILRLWQHVCARNHETYLCSQKVIKSVLWHVHHIATKHPWPKR